MGLKPFRIIYLALGFLSLGIGVIGIVVPILPTTPLLLLASFFFAKGSNRFHKWFLSTSIYKKHLHPFVTSRAMTLKTKLSILIPVSLMLLLAIYLVPSLHVRIFLVILIVVKYYYFIFRIKTIKKVLKDVPDTI